MPSIGGLTRVLQCRFYYITEEKLDKVQVGATEIPRKMGMELLCLVDRWGLGLSL